MRLHDHDAVLSRRALLAFGGATLALTPLAGLSGCATPLPLAAPRPGATDVAAARLLDESAEAHGLAAYRRLHDINVSYDGRWRAVVGRLQPEVVDEGYRGAVEERLMPTSAISAQAYVGPLGRKHVTWRRAFHPGALPAAATATTTSSVDDGRIDVWLDGRPTQDPARLAAAALVAEGYRLFLLGPLWLAGRPNVVLASSGRASVDGRECDLLQAWISPGLGRTPVDRLELAIDRSDRVMRRVRFTLEGFVNTQGAVAEVETFAHRRIGGVLWPMRSFERVVAPVPIPAHDWHVTGLDLDRGIPEALDGPTYTGLAAAPAAPVAAG